VRLLAVPGFDFLKRFVINGDPHQGQLIPRRIGKRTSKPVSA
jgi:hypothetical protein